MKTIIHLTVSNNVTRPFFNVELRVCLVFGLVQDRRVVRVVPYSGMGYFGLLLYVWMTYGQSSDK